jgi:hypothetical protein
MIACSDPCAARLDTDRRAFNTVRQKATSQHRISGIMCIAIGCAFGIFGLYHLTRPRYFLPLTFFMMAMSLGMIAAGIAYLRAAKDPMK